MPLTRVVCPECGAGLKSSTGFVVGQTIGCPKCETDFTVEEPDDEPVRPAKATASKKPVRATASRADDDDEDEDDRPKKKKKKRPADDEDGEQEWSYKSSWIRYAVLGVLIVVMAVLGFMLYQKRVREREDARVQEQANADGAGPNLLPMMQPNGPNVGRPGPQGPNGANVKMNVTPITVTPLTPGQPIPQRGGNAGVGPLSIFGGATPASSPEGLRLLADFTRRLVGTWTGTAPDGSTHRVEYRADWTFSHTITTAGTAKAATGTYTIAGLVGNKGLKLQRPIGTRAEARVVFEDDELIHDSGTPGEAVVLRKRGTS